MHIMICNDDGILASGLRELASYLSQYYRITVIAPEVEQSAKSHALTTEIPLKVKNFSNKEANPRLLAVTGTPSDCMKLGLSYLLQDDMPDLVLSGINNGYNLGSDVLYSGTVSAAMEAVFYNIPALALSVETYSTERGNQMHPFIKAFIDKVIIKEQFKGLLNINFPKSGLCNWDHVEVVHQGTQFYTNIIDPRVNKRGHDYYWLGGTLIHEQEDLPTDVDRIQHGVITVVPLKWKQEDDTVIRYVKNLLT